MASERMVRTITCVVLLGMMLPTSGAARCTTCHAKLEHDPCWAHSFQDWQDSMHAHFDVSCVNCHGGDSEASAASVAHADMAFTRQHMAGAPSSHLVLADGCGNCHADQIAGFRASPHYRALQEGQQAADCTTCHGAVGASVLNPQTITDTCCQCHPDESPGNTVEVARTLLDYTHRVRMALVFPEPGQRLEGEEREKVDEAISAAMAAWHEFNLEAVGLALAHGTGVLEK